MGDLGRLRLDEKFLVRLERGECGVIFAVSVWNDLLPGFAAKQTTFLVLNTPGRCVGNNVHNENGGICAKHRRNGLTF